MQYWKLQNNDGKCWLIPTRHVSTALAIYQPGAWRGRWLKRLLPLLNCCGRLFPFPQVENPIDEVLRQRLEALFPGRRLEYSLFLGTPSVHQKTVIQIYEGQQILAYAKVTDNPRVKALFDHEQCILQYLHEQGVEHVPTCLFNGVLDTDRQLFVMTTEKKRSSRNVHCWTSLHSEFIRLLQQQTMCTMPFEDSDYAKMLDALRQRVSTWTDGSVLLDEIDRVDTRYRGTTMSMVVMHADFTPWNMLVQHNHLYVFDWEYALRTAPVGLDEQHFFVQTAIHEQHLSPEQIVWHYRAQHAVTVDEERLKMYLLLQIAIYVCREKPSVVPTNISTYTTIIKLLHNEQ